MEKGGGGANVVICVGRRGGGGACSPYTISDILVEAATTDRNATYNTTIQHNHTTQPYNIQHTTQPYNTTIQHNHTTYNTTRLNYSTRARGEGEGCAFNEGGRDEAKKGC